MVPTFNSLYKSIVFNGPNKLTSFLQTIKPIPVPFLFSIFYDEKVANKLNNFGFTVSAIPQPVSSIEIVYTSLLKDIVGCLPYRDFRI